MIDVSLNSFIQQIREARPDLNETVLLKIREFILNSGCQKIEFGPLSDNIMGLSMYDQCTINKRLLSIKTEYFLYILLHEISHQFQYKKYGSDLTLNIYLDEYDIESAIDQLMYLEKTADRLAIKKLGSLTKYFKLERVVPRYLNVTDKTYFRKYLTDIRHEVSKKNCTTMDDINRVLRCHHGK